MRWGRFSRESGDIFPGIVEGERVLEARGDPFATWEKTGRVHQLADLKIEVPVVPRIFYAAGRNYEIHAKAYGDGKGGLKKPDVGYRSVGSLIASGETVVIPADATEEVQYEGELVAVIGRKAKNIAKEEAYGCVFGYTIGNDVSERSWLRSDATMWRAKNTDTFNPMGPWIETDVDLDRMETTVRVNGEESIRFKTGEMIFGIDTYISAISRYITLCPGDILWMGTEGKSPNLVDGDVVEIDISGIGTLRNPFRKN